MDILDEYNTVELIDIFDLWMEVDELVENAVMSMTEEEIDKLIDEYKI